MKWIDQNSAPAGTAADLFHKMISTITSASGLPPAVKDVELEALTDTLRMIWIDSPQQPDFQQIIQYSAKALSDIGSETMARRVLVFGSGLVDRCFWQISAGHRMWMLDVGLLFSRTEPLLELTVVMALALVMDSISEVWDESRGRGVLGIRALEELAGRICADGGRRGQRRRERLADDLLYFIKMRLEAEASSRDWQRAPDVVILGKL